jgi:hypothetical protein
MAFVTTGLTNGGVTAHYRFSYDDALGRPGGVEPARTNAVIAACESDYNLMVGWFGGVTVTGMSVQVTTASNGASWSGTSTSSTIQLNAQGAGYSSDSGYLRYLLIAEVTEILMMTQARGWFQGSDEGSKGEGLSRFLSGQFLAMNTLLNLGIDADYALADLWLNSPRQDFVNNAPDDHGANAINGCTTLFIYYLFHQLGFSIDDIVGAAGATLATVYRNLTGDPNDPFPLFKRLLDERFPSSTGSAVPGPNFDDPWPLGDVAWAGVWRSGDLPYYLWIHAPKDEFAAKWQTLASQNMRLTDIDVSTVNGRELWSGIWEEGTDGYWLWYDADQDHFIAKYQELAAQNFRLVSLARYGDLYAGAWRGGSDGYWLWVDADDDHFLAKWQELAGQNFRLVDFDVTNVGGQRRWSGAWRAGADGYYLWINADWPHFRAKWEELASQGLRLIGLQEYDGLWAGIWREGSDAYYLWVDANESAFLAKWGGLAAQGLRLIDVFAAPFGGTGGAATPRGAEAEAADLDRPAEVARPVEPRPDAGEPVMSAPAGSGTMSAAAGSGGGSAAAASVSDGDPQASGQGHGGGPVRTTARAEGTGVGGGSAMAKGAAVGTPAASGWGGGAPAPASVAFSAAAGAPGTGAGSVGKADEPKRADETMARSARRTGAPGTGGGVVPGAGARPQQATAGRPADPPRGAGYGGGVHERGGRRAAR